MVALSPTMRDGVIAGWNVQEGQSVRAGDSLCEVETDKASMPYEAPKAGTILKILVSAGGTAAVGQAIAVLGKSGEDWAAVVADSSPSSPAPAIEPAEHEQTSTMPSFPALGPVAAPLTAKSPPLSSPPRSSPLARKLARAHNLDIRGIRGTGTDGRVVARDIESYAENQTQFSAAPVAATMPSQHTGESVAPGRLRSDREPLSRMRSIIAERLKASYNDAPHYFVRSAVDVERLLELRETVTAGQEKRLSLNAFIMRIVAAALERHPLVNARWEGDAIRYMPNADLALAVAREHGLVTPVVRACEGKSVRQIDAELGDLVKRARDGTLSPEHYSNATFTISNLGSFGVEEFTAIINPPASAILAVGAIGEEARVIRGAIVVRRMMRITLSSDHRVIDGAVAAAFMAELKEMLEEPGRVLV
ncbi:MAG: 2-oxo acid dehydrogenase subunit E2 [Spirochaetales bacterium]|nr:2-oxo acid dehydrogenase subunit E2 [Spirochaetales bacterium]